VLTAFVQIQAVPDRVADLATELADVEGVSEVYSVTGEIDLVAMVRVREHQEVADVVADRLNKIPGVLRTETHIAFRTFSKHDLEAAFALGVEDAD
jgi:DNA-binding Lrp family transcriptional regulator